MRGLWVIDYRGACFCSWAGLFVHCYGVGGLKIMPRSRKICWNITLLCSLVLLSLWNLCIHALESVWSSARNPRNRLDISSAVFVFIE